MDKKKIKNTILTVVILTIVIIAVAAALIFTKKNNETKLNDLPSANGNTSGNLYNDGLFAEADGKVYFSNPYDKGCLYVMNEDETEASKLSEETVYSLNAYGDYLYYCKNNLDESQSTSVLRGSVLGAARCNLDGSNIVDLNDKYTGAVVLVGNTILFQDYENDREKEITTFDIKSIGIDGKNPKVLVDEPIEIAGVYGTTIYYSGTGRDHNIYSLNTKTGTSSTILEGNYWMPSLYQDGSSIELYYIDLENNYALMRANAADTTEQTVVVSQRISTYNVSDTYIYFQIDDQENSKLCRIRRDASTDEYEVILEGNYENINITPNYVYFNQFDNPAATYRTPVNGPLHIESFSEAVNFQTK